MQITQQLISKTRLQHAAAAEHLQQAVTNARADRAVLLLGSSGGGAANLGHTDPSKRVQVVFDV
jgi:hypothetical protein